MRRLFLQLFAFGVVAWGLAAPAQAAGVYYNGINLAPGGANSVNVQAYFSAVSDNLFTLTLRYFSGNNVGNAAVLTGFVWDMPGSVSLAIGPPETAGVVTGAGTYLIKTTDQSLQGGPGTNLNIYWAYSQPPSDPTGVASAGGSLFGTPDIIGTDPEGTYPPLDGTDYGLVPYGTLFGGGLTGGKDKTLIQSQVSGTPTSIVFSFQVVDGPFDPSTDITNGRFLFGSDLSVHPGTRVPETPPIVPAPTGWMALVSLATAAALFAHLRRRTPVAS